MPIFFLIKQELYMTVWSPKLKTMSIVNIRKSSPYRHMFKRAPKWAFTDIFLWALPLIEGHSTIYFWKMISIYLLLNERWLDIFKISLIRRLASNVYSEVVSKKPWNATASKYTISYQDKDFKKSIVHWVILSQIRLQRLNSVTFALVDIFTNIILE